MQNHQHGPQCQHGHGQGGQGGGHGHGGHGHGGMQGMGFAGQAPEESPEEYFKSLGTKWSEKEKRVFFWQQVLHGVVIDRFYERIGLDFMRSFTCQMPQMLVQTIEMMLNFSWVPLQLKPITSGMFFPLLILLFFNYNVVVGMANQDNTLKALIYSTMTLYLLVAFRGCSPLNNTQTKDKCKEIIEVRPYLENPAMNCQQCKIVRMFRATHCPICKTCVAKHSRHSIVFGSCIGAANELLCVLFFMSLTVTLGVTVASFWQTNTYGLLTKIMFYLMNVPFCWLSLAESAGFIVFNYVYGVTEQELKMWPMMQYLQKIPDKGFCNNISQGFCLNLVGSIMALIGIQGYESERQWAVPGMTFPAVDPKRGYPINWAVAVIYLIPQLPFHKNRAQILEMMQRDEPRMIEMFKMQKRFKEEALAEAEAGNEQLNQFQMQQKVAMKMQAHMAKNMPQMMAPSADQQRNMQMQMLAHMKREFATETDLLSKFNELESKLKEGELTPIEVNMQMRMLQQELMSRRMKKVSKQLEDQKESEKNKHEEEETPMRETNDEDL